MAVLTNDFYRDLYKSEGKKDIDVVLDAMSQHVTSDMNEGMVASIKASEVKEALFQMFPTKPLGQMIYQHTSFSVIGVYAERKPLVLF
jgi:hypothetical protein